MGRLGGAPAGQRRATQATSSTDGLALGGAGLAADGSPSARTPAASDAESLEPLGTYHALGADMEVDHRGTGVLLDMHGSEVFCVAYVGSCLVSSALDGSIHSRDKRTHELLGTSADAAAERGGPHQDGVFSVGGWEDRCYSLSWDGMLKAWALPTLELLSTTAAHERTDASARYGGFALAAARGGQLLATGGGDGCRKLRLWGVGGGRAGADGAPRLLHTAEGAHHVVQHLAFSPDASVLASIGSEGTIRLWSMSELTQLASQRHTSNKACAFAPSGRLLASCGADRALRLWSVPHLELRAQRANAHASEVRALAFAPGGATIATCAVDSSVRLWAAASLQPLQALSGAHAGTVFGLAFAPHDGGRTFTTCGADRAIKRWATATLAMRTGLRKRTLPRACVGVGFLSTVVGGASGADTADDDARQLLFTVAADLSLALWDLSAPTASEAAAAAAAAEAAADSAHAATDATADGLGGATPTSASRRGARESAAERGRASVHRIGPVPLAEAKGVADGEARRGAISADGGLVAVHAGRRGELLFWALRVWPVARFVYLGSHRAHATRSDGLAFAPAVEPPPAADTAHSPRSPSSRASTPRRGAAPLSARAPLPAARADGHRGGAAAQRHGSLGFGASAGSSAKPARTPSHASASSAPDVAHAPAEPPRRGSAVAAAQEAAKALRVSIDRKPSVAAAAAVPVAPPSGHGEPNGSAAGAAPPPAGPPSRPTPSSAPLSKSGSRRFSLLGSGRPPSKLVHSHTPPPRSARFAADGGDACSEEEGEPEAGESSPRASGMADEGARELATGSEDGSIRIWVVRAPPAAAVAAAHAPGGGGGGALNATTPGSVLLEQIGACEEAHGGEYVSDVCYSPDGLRLASSSVFSELRLWACRRKYRRGRHAPPSSVVLQPLFALPHAHPRDASSYAQSGLAWAPGGATLASSADTLRVWKVAAGGALELEQEVTLQARCALAYTADGFELALGCADGGVQVYWTQHMPPTTATPFAAVLDALEHADLDALAALPSAWFGLRDERSGPTHGWTPLHHAVHLGQPGAVGALLGAAPGALADAMAPPFDGVRRLAGGELRVLEPPLPAGARGGGPDADPTALRGADGGARRGGGGSFGRSAAAARWGSQVLKLRVAQWLSAAPTPPSATPHKRSSLGARRAPTKRGGGGAHESPLRALLAAPSAPTVPSVIDVALAGSSSLDAKMCLALVLEGFTRLARSEPDTTALLTTTDAGARLLPQLLQVGTWHADLLAATLPALSLVHQPGGTVTVTIVGREKLYAAFSDEPLPLGLAREAKADSADHVARVMEDMAAAARALRVAPGSPRRRGSHTAGRRGSRARELIRSLTARGGSRAAGEPPSRARSHDALELARSSGASDDDAAAAAGDSGGARRLASRRREEEVAGVVAFWTSRRRGRSRPEAVGAGVRGSALASTFTSCVVPLSGDLVGYLEALESLNGRRTRTALYDNNASIAVVHALWTHGAGKCHALMCCLYALLIGVVAADALLFNSGMPRWTLLICAAPFAAFEIGTAFTSDSLLAYLASTYNYFDWATYVLLAMVAIPDVLPHDSERRRCVHALLLVLMGFRVLFYMRAYTTLVRTIMQALRDLGAFAGIVVMILLSFSLAFSVLQSGGEGAGRGAQSADLEQAGAFLRVFALMLGEFDITEFTVGPERTPTSIVAQALFYAYVCLVAIVLLNLLITILSDSYDLSTERRKAELTRMRAQLAVEYYRLLPWLLRPRGRWVHVLISSALLAEQRREFELEGTQAMDDDWASRLSVIKVGLMHLRRDTASAVAKLERQLGACNARIENNATQLEAILGAVQGILAAQQVNAPEDGLGGGGGGARERTAPRQQRRSMQIAQLSPKR